MLIAYAVIFFVYISIGGFGQYCSTRMDVPVVQPGVFYIDTTGDGNYPNSLQRCWVLVPGGDNYLTVEFQTINTEPNYE
jgi:hypothetical protein